MKPTTRRFFSLRIPFFGTVAIALVCVVFFILPFVTRGARMGIRDIQNNVADWLPNEYAETQDLVEFRKYFYGDQFVVVSGPWCNEGDPVYARFKEAIRRESLEYEKDLKAAGREEELRAHRKGDELGLLHTGDFHQTWGENNEKWLQGKNGTWYFINRRGQLFRWDGQNNLIDGLKRFVERTVHGTNKAKGTYIATFSPPMDDGTENPFYQDPTKLCCRPFKTIISGPEAFRQMAGPEGTLRIQKSGEADLSAFQAEMQAHKVLTGALFGPTPHRTFNWTFDSLLQEVDSRLRAKLKSDANYQKVYEQFIAAEVETKYDGDLNGLIHAKQGDRLETWYRLWHQLELSPPPRQTCFVVTLNDPVINELARVIGRPLMGKPRGRLLQLGSDICGIDANNLRLGGPPCDNVAIDEEGTNTLVRLAGLSLVVGMSLAYLCFGRIRVAAMVFFVGAMSAITSLAIVWYGGSSMDAILMTMPSLVYVLALSASVHYVNYYREACHESGARKAPEVAFSHSWLPCVLAAFTTALGLISLTSSNLTPIYKFGLFSAIAVNATVLVLYLYLPSALTIWKPGYKQQSASEGEKPSFFFTYIGNAIDHLGNWVIAHHRLVTIVMLTVTVGLSLGLRHVDTTVQLLKLFDRDAKILKDYEWLEEHLGELVPAEIVICVDKDVQREAYAAEIRNEQTIEARRKAAPGTPEETFDDMEIQFDQHELALKYSILERLELSSRVRQQLETFFGADGLGIVGSGMSTDVFTPLYRIKSNTESVRRFGFSSELHAKKNEMVAQDYLAVVEADPNADETTRHNMGREMWRISIRLAALNNVDYGRFVNDLKSVVEPVLLAYQYRTRIFNELHAELGERAGSESRVLVLGPDPANRAAKVAKQVNADQPISNMVDQTFIFSDTLRDLFENRGIVDQKKKERKYYRWLDIQTGLENASTSPEKRKEAEDYYRGEPFNEYLQRFDCVVLVETHPLIDVEKLKQNAKRFVDCRDHKFVIDPHTYLPVAGATTMRERDKSGEAVGISAIYTGIVPIVYKAQRALLESLIQSTAMSFVMIAVVMMILLRNWKRRLTVKNALNFRGGMLSMIPNIFPVFVVFGCMGWAGIEVDIGSMMTASVAMGIAVDDTIHFLNWFSDGISKGMNRQDAIRHAYRRVGPAMIQTTLICGLGLATFALSTFTPTQKFGIMMLVLLSTATLGDLFMLPAFLAGPLGKYFEHPPEEGSQNSSLGTPELATESGSVKFRVISDEDSHPTVPGKPPTAPGKLPQRKAGL